MTKIFTINYEPSLSTVFIWGFLERFYLTGFGCGGCCVSIIVLNVLTNGVFSRIQTISLFGESNSKEESRHCHG